MAICKSGGGRTMAQEMGVPFLGQIPIDPPIVASGDDGQPYIDIFAQSAVAKIFLRTIQPILTSGENP
ncbi:Mrp/NBP35 family ATP-binding protein [candidate division KSB1 bacterium]|nr:Mrp/NBP35 family ATP-binding protein [candidate division KSB1 bacterium]